MYKIENNKSIVNERNITVKICIDQKNWFFKIFY